MGCLVVMVTEVTAEDVAMGMVFSGISPLLDDDGLVDVPGAVEMGRVAVVMVTTFSMVVLFGALDGGGCGD